MHRTTVASLGRLEGWATQFVAKTLSKAKEAAVGIVISTQFYSTMTKFCFVQDLGGNLDVQTFDHHCMHAGDLPGGGHDRPGGGAQRSAGCGAGCSQSSLGGRAWHAPKLLSNPWPVLASGSTRGRGSVSPGAFWWGVHAGARHGRTLARGGRARRLSRKVRPP